MHCALAKEVDDKQRWVDYRTFAVPGTWDGAVFADCPVGFLVREKRFRGAVT